MDAYEIDTIKIEKAKVLTRYRTFQKITTIFKIVEIFVAIFGIIWSISWSSTYLPTAVNFADYLRRRVISVLLSSHFVFIIGNAIVITLFAISREYSRSSSGDGDRNSEACFFCVDTSPMEELVVPPVPVEQKKELEITVVEKQKSVPEEKNYRRTKSSMEIVIAKEKMKMKKKELRRSETEPRRKIGKSPENPRSFHDVNDLSGEEFRKKVEAFIEKQQRFRMEESKAVVVSNNNCNKNSMGL